MEAVQDFVSKAQYIASVADQIVTNAAMVEGLNDQDLAAELSATYMRYLERAGQALAQVHVNVSHLSYAPPTSGPVEVWLHVDGDRCPSCGYTLTPSSVMDDPPCVIV